MADPVNVTLPQVPRGKSAIADALLAAFAAKFGPDEAPDLAGAVAAAATELRRLNEQAERDLRFTLERIEDVGHLKRRLEQLRSGVRAVSEFRCLGSMEEMAEALRSDLKRDDRAALRFRRKRRAKLAKLREAARG